MGTVAFKTIDERLSNIAANIASVKKRAFLPLPAHGDTVQLVCYGPSLRRTWQRLSDKRAIVTVSGAHDFLREQGITPTYHVEFDWRAHKAKHVNDPGDTWFYLASCVHPELVNKLKKVVLWHPQQSKAENAFIAESEPNAHLVPGGSSAGLRAIELFYALGYRKFEIHGMDSSFEDQEWAGPHHGTARLKRDVIEVPVLGRKFKTSIAFLMYAGQFNACKAAHPDVTFNLHGDGLIQTMNKMEKAA